MVLLHALCFCLAVILANLHPAASESAQASIMRRFGQGPDFVKSDKNPGNMWGLGLQKGKSGLIGGIGGPNKPPPKPIQNNDEPPPPNPEDDAEGPICMDLVIVLDVSCSIALEDREKARHIAYEVIEEFTEQPATDIRVGLLTYDGQMSHAFYLNNFTAAADILEAIEDVTLTMSVPNCRTHSHIALRDVRNMFFKSENGDRSDTKNVVLFFSDGRTIQQKFRQKTINAAARLKTDKVDIYMVGLPNNRGKPKTEEFERIPSDPLNTHFFDSSDEEVIEQIINEWSNNHGLDNCDPGFTGDARPGCVDLVFAFDFSCSIDDVDRQYAVDVAKQIIRDPNIIINPTQGAIVAAFSFDALIENRKPATGFYSATDKEAFIAMLDSMNQAGFGCKTRTYEAFRSARDLLTNADRNDTEYHDAMVVFSDGRTAPLHYRAQTLLNAQALKKDGVLIAWGHLPSNRGQVKQDDGITNEVKIVASSTTDPSVGGPLVFMRDDPDVAETIATWIVGHDFMCPEPET